MSGAKEKEERKPAAGGNVKTKRAQKRKKAIVTLTRLATQRAARSTHTSRPKYKRECLQHPGGVWSRGADWMGFQSEKKKKKNQGSEREAAGTPGQTHLHRRSHFDLHTRQAANPRDACCCCCCRCSTLTGTILDLKVHLRAKGSDDTGRGGGRNHRTPRVGGMFLLLL